MAHIKIVSQNTLPALNILVGYDIYYRFYPSWKS